MRGEVGVTEEQRAFREEEPDRVLHRIDAAHEIVPVHEVEELDDVVHR